MKDIEAWAFLVGCNQYLDYRTVVAPSFMCESKISSLLAKVAGGDLTEKGVAYYREIHNSKVGDLTLIYRVVEATSENTGIQGNGVLKDLFGREINLIEGIVCQGLQPDIVVTQDNLEEIHQNIIIHYLEFWNMMNSVSPIALESMNCFRENSLDKRITYIYLKNYNVIDANFDKSLEKKQRVKSSQNWLLTSASNKPYDGEIVSVSYLPNQNSLLYRYDRSIIVTNIKNNQSYKLFDKRKIRFGDCPTPVVTNRNGSFIATAMIEAGDQNVVMIWKAENLWNINNILQPIKYEGHQFSRWGRTRTVAFSPDNTILLSAGVDETIFLWDVNGGGELGKLYGHSTTVTTVVISTDGRFMASGDEDGNIKIWNWQTKQEIDQINVILPVRTLAFSPDNKTLASAGDDCFIKLWNTDTKTEITEFDAHTKPINTVFFSPDGQMLASGSDDCTIKLWDVQKQTEIAELKEHTKGVTSVSFSSDGQTLVSGSKDQTIRLWKRSSM